jgi:hypothetical protein
MIKTINPTSGKNDLFLTGCDVYRIAKHLGSTPEEVVSGYCEVFQDSKTKLPMVRLLPQYRPAVSECICDIETDESEAWNETLSRIIPVLQDKPDVHQILFYSVFSLLYLALDTNKCFAEEIRRNLNIFIGNVVNITQK